MRCAACVQLAGRELGGPCVAEALAAHGSRVESAARRTCASLRASSWSLALCSSSLACSTRTKSRPHQTARTHASSAAKPPAGHSLAPRLAQRTAVPAHPSLSRRLHADKRPAVG